MTGRSRGAPRGRPPRGRLRSALALLLCLCGLFSAVACQGAVRAGGPVTLSLWARSDESGFMNQIVDRFNRSHRDVRVKLTIIPSDTFVQKLGIAVAGGSGPDLASIDLVYVPFFASSGVLADITDRTRHLPELDELSRAHLAQGSYQGRRYALPFTGDASVLYYNKDLFRKAGLDPDRPPRDWRTFLADARRISALGHGRYGYHFSGRCGGCNIFTLTPFVWASGGNVVTGPVGRERPVVGRDPAVARALRLYRTMWREKLMPPQAAADTGAQALTLFGGGRVGMYATGAFALQEMRARYPHVHLGVAPIPGRHGGSASFAGGDDIAITSRSHHKDAAWQFMKWSTRADVQRENFSGAGTLPVRTDVALGSYGRRSPQNAALARALVHGRTVRSVQENALFNANTSPWATMIAKGVFGGGSGGVDHAVADAQAAMDNILARG